MIDDPENAHLEDENGELPPVKLSEEEKAEIKRDSLVLVEELLAILNREFYAPGSRDFFQQRDQLRRAIGEPARWATRKGVLLDIDHCREILLKVVRNVKEAGKLDEVRFFCAYFRKSVQGFMADPKNNDHYLAIGIKIRDGLPLKRAMKWVSSQQVNETPQQFTESLADLTRVLGAGRPKKATPPKPADPQLGLL